MRLALDILDGNNKGKRIFVRSGLKLGATIDGLSFKDSELSDFSAEVFFDEKNRSIIRCLGSSKIRLGLDEVEQISLLPGLVFHLGQTGFKVTLYHSKETSGTWRNNLMDWLEDNLPEDNQPNPDFFFFLRPVRLFFTQGPQYEEVYTLSYGPRELGFNNLDIALNEPSLPEKVVRFFQVADQAYVENLCGDLATINGKVFDQKPLVSGDILKVGSNAIEMSILS
jgi:hypothetical protein